MADSILIVANLEKADAEEQSVQVQQHVQARGWNAEIFAFRGHPATKPDVAAYRLVISLGGDGTLLWAARIAGPLGVPILPVNLGTLGFIASNRRETWLETFDLWSSGMLGFSRRLMLAVEAYRGQEKLYHGHALNDVVVSSEGNARMIRMCLSINGECFGNYRADGLIAATPTGSTAYNLAAGGPAVYPEMSAIIINPICPFTLASRPLLVPGDMPIEISIEETRRMGALLTVDGQEMLPLCRGDSVLLSRHVRDVLLVVPGGNAFFHALRSKLGWSGGSDA